MNYYNSAEELIGATPLIKLNNLKEKYGLGADIFGKLEAQNPAGSIKDRAARQMIADAEEKGLLRKDSVIIEPTSGNTGIGLALVGALRGYRVILVMPDTMSVERRTLMTVYGAEVVLSDGSLGMKGAIDKANELAAGYEHSYIPQQFDNPSNAKAHFLTTGPEIWDDLDGNVGALVSGVGTGGTITGTGAFLKSKNPDVKVIAVEPEGSPVLSLGRKGPHKIQGIGAGFVPSLLDTGIYDEVIRVSDADSLEMFRLLPELEGLFVGISSGAALFAGAALAARPEYKGKNIAVILPDSGSRYLSTF